MASRDKYFVNDEFAINSVLQPGYHHQGRSQEVLVPIFDFVISSFLNAAF